MESRWALCVVAFLSPFSLSLGAASLCRKDPTEEEETEHGGACLDAISGEMEREQRSSEEKSATSNELERLRAEKQDLQERVDLALGDAVRGEARHRAMLSELMEQLDHLENLTYKAPPSLDHVYIVIMSIYGNLY